MWKKIKEWFMRSCKYTAEVKDCKKETHLEVGPLSMNVIVETCEEIKKEEPTKTIKQEDTPKKPKRKYNKKKKVKQENTENQ